MSDNNPDIAPAKSDLPVRRVVRLEAVSRTKTRQWSVARISADILKLVRFGYAALPSLPSRAKPLARRRESGELALGGAGD